MGFFSEIIGATVKTVLTPVAVAVDAVKVVTGGEANVTKDLVKSAVNDVAKGLDDLADGDL